MKLCIVCLGVGKVKGGGILNGGVNSILNLSKELSSRGHQLHIVTTYPLYFDSACQQFDSPSISIHYLTFSPIIGKHYAAIFFIKALKKITELHRRECFDLILGQSAYSLLASVPAIVGKMNRLPKVHILTSPLEQKDILSKLWFKVLFSQLDLIIAISNNVAKSLKNIVPDRKIRVAPPCIDLSIYNPKVSGEDVRKKHSLNNTPAIFFLGNLRRARDIRVVVDALEIVKEAIPSIKLLMGLIMPIAEYQSGSFELKDKIKSANLDHNIIPLGILSNVAQYMAASDVFIAPLSSIKGVVDYPLTILQAMACGTPVVATNVGGIPQIIKHGVTGLLIEPEDAVGLANAIICLLKDKGRAVKMGERGAKYVLAEFNPDVIAGKLEDILQEVCC